MASEVDHIPLAVLDWIPYVDVSGQLPAQFQGQVGVYAIFDEGQILQYVGYSRDVFFSLKQHLVRQPLQCHWVKVRTIARPDRTLLETIKTQWISENGATPVGNSPEGIAWTEAIAVTAYMTAEEQAAYAGAIDELAQAKLLKQVARRIEAEIMTTLQARGVQTEIRFNPKLKESGLLDLKSG
jgi:hypothetical protein